MDLARELKELLNMKVTVIPIVIRALRTVIKVLIKGAGGLGNKKESRDHLNDRVIKIGLNTKKIPGDLKGHAVTQTPEKKHIG